MSEVERCPECGGLAGPDGVLSHGYVHVRHETGGGGMNRRCSQTPKPEEPTVVAVVSGCRGGGSGLFSVVGPASDGPTGGGGGYDPRALTALAKNLDKARDWAAWFAAEAAYWRDGAKLMDALVLLGEASKAMSDRDAEVDRLRAERDKAIRERDDARATVLEAVADRQRLREERDAMFKDLSDARFKLGVANGQVEAMASAALDPGSPADLRRADFAALVRDLLGVIDAQKVAIEAHQAEEARLREWKTQAMSVMEGIQDLGAALGVPLGASCTGREALAGVHRLQDALARVQALCAKWEAEAKKTHWTVSAVPWNARELRAALAGDDDA